MAYPTSLDVLTDPSGAALMNDPALLHSVVEKKQNDAIEAIQTTLGLNPHGGFLTVAARLSDIEGDIALKLDASQKAAASGVASLDASSFLVQNVDATKIASGLLPMARLANIPVSKIDTASGTFNVNNIPSLDAAKVTTGVLGLSRIPGLPGNWITSGTIDAARLPSSVTANANATVVADQTARDAIPMGDRADGKLVLQRTPLVLWAWRADNSTWVQAGGTHSVAYSGTTDANGYLTVTHGAGFTPVGGWAATTNPSTSFAYFWGIDTMGATTVRLRFGTTSAFGALANTAVQGRLFVVR